MQRIPLIILSFILFGIMPQIHAQEAQFNVVDCPFVVLYPEVEGETMYCAELTVPENRQQNTGKVITLAVVVVKSQSAPDGVPVVNLEGGPGGSATAAVDAWYVSALRELGDIILIDQRGTGRSEPSLNCDEFTDDSTTFEDFMDEASEVAIAIEMACRERLEAEGIDVGAYNTRENAADIADLVRAMGYDQVNLYGSSYGTRLALVVMRDHPDIVRSAILDAVYPFGIDEHSEQTPNGEAAITGIINACMQDAACNVAYPDLMNVFVRTVNNLNDEPLSVYDTEFEEDIPFTGDDLVNMIFSMLYDTQQIGLVPYLIYTSYERDAATLSDFGSELTAEDESGEAVDEFFSPLSGLSDEEVAILMMEYVEADSFEAAETYIDSLTEAEYEELIIMLEQDYILLQYLELDSFAALWEITDPMSWEEYNELLDAAYGIIDDDSEGMYNSVHCRETLPFTSLDDVQAQSESVDEPIRSALMLGVQAQFESCDIWDVAPAAPDEIAQTVSDIPTLLLSGEFDPITPPAWGQAAASTLSRGYHYTLPGMGHGTVDIEACPTQIAVDFLTNPSAQPDASCIAEMPGVTFYFR